MAQDISRSPQLEDGHIRIANELYDAIFSFGFKGSTLHVLGIVMRKTYGYGKKEDDISASQIGGMCNMSRQHVTTALNELAAMNVIHKRPGKYGVIIGVNKDYSEWIASPKSGQANKSRTSPNIGQVSKKEGFTSPKFGQVDSPRFGHTKDNLPKDNKQKNCTEELSLSMPTEQRTPTPIAKLPLVDGSEYEVFAEQAREWSLAYPAVDVGAELIRMRVWLTANARKRKTKRGIAAFVVAWLSKTQDRPRQDSPAHGPRHSPASNSAEDHFELAT